MSKTFAQTFNDNDEYFTLLEAIAKAIPASILVYGGVPDENVLGDTVCVMRTNDGTFRIEKFDDVKENFKDKIVVMYQDGVEVLP